MAKAKMTATRHPGVYRHSKDNRLVVRVTLRDANGRQHNRTKTLAPHATVADAVIAAQAARQSLQLELAGAPQRETIDADVSVTAYAERWLRGKATRSKHATNLRYAGDLAVHILPTLGHLRVAQLSRADVEAWVGGVERAKQTNGKPYARATVAGWWRVLRVFLRDMAADHDLPDPTRRVKPPRIQQERGVRERQTLNADQLSRFLAAAADLQAHRYAEILMLARTGIRPGAMYALRWEDLDLAGGWVTVRRAVSAGVVSDTTKTRNARDIPLTPDLVEALEAQRQQWIRSHPNTMPNGLVWSTVRSRTRYDSETGEPISYKPAGSPRIPESLRKPLVCCSEAIGLPWVVGPQVLRRTVNTKLRDAGVLDAVVRQILGHVTESQGRLYTGDNPEAKQKAILQLIDGATGRPS